MNDFIRKVFSFSDENNNCNTINEESTESKKENKILTVISKSIEENRKNVEIYFSNCFDVVLREITAFNPQKKVLIVYLDGLSEKNIIEDLLISKLTSECGVKNESFTEEAIKFNLGLKDTEIKNDMEKSFEAIISGNPVVFIDGIDKSFEINISSPPGRDVNEPSSEVVLRGPREGFTESLTQNVSLLRKKIKNSNLKTEKFVIGKKTNTNVAIIYLSDMANEKIVNEVRRRVKDIDIESVLDSNYVEEYISDSPLSIVPIVFRTEKPDIAASKILEGKVVLIVDGSPVALSVPAIFIEFLHSGEDHYLKYTSALLNRIVRFSALIITLTLPSIYVALTNFHQELIPTKLAISIINAREGVPFPVFWECIFMLSTFEIIREAGVRMPKAMGTSISIVGGLVLGDAAVKAGLVGTPMVGIVSLTAITKFTISSIELELPIVYIRFIFMVLSGSLGLAGLTCGFLLVSMRLVSIRSFGVPYMYPICPFNMKLEEDVIFRAPIYKLNVNQKLLNIKMNLKRGSVHKGSK
ncbi:spore germination protein [Clostridium zeae]|uniref:Spore germination protein n=1 Tax=Clostridium zeae TaxID=2759022 RepID=A0ABQ1ECT7_9CLOT|nr:spore germination protein [Clostridium zeae]GFZ32592.1 spore germination protein [Clostridium zeae]